jgi:ribosome biogenesis GTPase
VVDTPGLREFGLWNLGPAELGAAFPEIAHLSPACRFPNCSHVHEPDCEVQQAAAAGEIDRGRYASYRAMVEDS